MRLKAVPFSSAGNIKIVDGFGSNIGIIGGLIQAEIHQQEIRQTSTDEDVLNQQEPLLPNLDPNGYTRIIESYTFHFGRDFSR